MIRVMIVDDSITARRLLRHIIDAAPDMEVIAELADGKEAVAQVAKLRPDLILMDIVMPAMDGMEATGEIMRILPTPIVMISGAIQGKETEMAFQAIKRGALTLLPKPGGPGDPEFETQSNHLVSTVRAMSGVRVIHHIPKQTKPKADLNGKTPLQQTVAVPPEIVGVVSSTGGPAALAEIFQHLPPEFALPVVVVQHIAGDFLPSLLAWLTSVSALPVQVAQAGDTPQYGIYFAPQGKHLYLDSEQRFAFRSTPIVTHIPSGDVLLESIAQQYGAAAVGMVLTGMGADGAQGLWHMHQQGAITIAQNQKTCAVYGMPAEAKKLEAVQYELSLNMIAPMLNDITEREYR